VTSIAAASSGRAGGRDHNTRYVPKHADRVVVVEVPAEPALVSVAGDPDHHSVPVRALREELQRRGLAAKLVLGVVEVREVLISGIGRNPLTAEPSASPRIDVSSSSVSKTRPAPKRACSPRVTP
jgi:hypothetical protein